MAERGHTYITSIMLDDELVGLCGDTEVSMALEGSNKLFAARRANMSNDANMPFPGRKDLPELVISAFGEVAHIVKNGHETGRALLFNKIAADLVVEVIDVLPLNALSKVLLLLGLERELDENLLQLFVDEVDAELLETVFLKKMKG